MATSIYLRYFPRSQPLYVSAVEGQGTIRVYWDENCTQATHSIEWGGLSPGKTNRVTVYARNEGNETVLLAVTALDWNPQNASSLISFSWSCQNNAITPGKTAKVDLALSLPYSSQPGFSTFGFDLAFEGTPNPTHLLNVASAHDSPSPSVGDSLYGDGSSVTCSVTSPVVEGSVSYTCTGWSGTGSAPSTGSGASVTFTITQNSSITWNWQTGSFVHDVAITNITSSKVIISQGYNASFRLLAEDQGTFTETFNVALYANNTIINTQTVTMTSGNFIDITFIWNTSGFAYGNYTISAYAEPILGETDTADNNLTSSKPITVSIPGDINGDGKANILDITMAARSYDSALGEQKFQPNADVNNDGIVNILDISLITKDYGKTG